MNRVPALPPDVDVAPSLSLSPLTLPPSTISAPLRLCVKLSSQIQSV
jgi:hypothetical protein